MMQVVMVAVVDDTGAGSSRGLSSLSLSLVVVEASTLVVVVVVDGG